MSKQRPRCASCIESSRRAKLTLLGLLLLLLGGRLGSTTSGSSGSTGRSGGGGTARRDGSELGRTLSDQLRKGKGWRRGIIVHIIIDTIIKPNININTINKPKQSADCPRAHMWGLEASN